MKTLQQEIVEMLRKASSTARKYAKSYDKFALSYHEYMDQSSEFDELAAKVESARCENCEYFDQSQDPDSGECVHKNNHNSELFDNKDAFSLNWADVEFGCWHFERKVK